MGMVLGLGFMIILCFGLVCWVLGAGSSVLVLSTVFVGLGT